MVRVITTGVLAVLVLLNSHCGPSFKNPLYPTTKFVLGQPDFSTNLNLARGFFGPMSVTTDGTKFYVCDMINHRIVTWNQMPTSSQNYPDAVLGQPSLNTGILNNGGLGPLTQYFPHEAVIAAGRLIVADSYNNRVLIWNSLPSSNLQQPDLVLGQTTFASNSPNVGGVSASTLFHPTSADSDGTRLFVADYLNNRVLLWNTFPTANGQAADLVLGQADFVSSGINQGASGLQWLQNPYVVRTDGTRLFVSDQNNHRLLVWHALPMTNHQAATLVLGQSSVSATSSNGAGSPSGSTMYHPWGMCTSNGKLAMADYSNNRVLVWNAIPGAGFHGTAADLVLGQSNFTSQTANSGGLSAKSLSGPMGLDCAGGALRVADATNNRILIFTAFPTASFAEGSLVLGQPDFASATINNPIVSGSRLNSPRLLDSDGKRLVVADTRNHRVLIWNSLPRSNEIAADVIVGQPTETTATMNTDGISARSLYYPASARTDGTRLFVADTLNNRVLIWNKLPTSNYQAADLVLGQPDMASSTANNGGIGGASLSGPIDVASDGTRLAISDTNNNRILVWESFPTSNFQAADVVLGQPNMTAVTANNGGTSAKSLSGPYAIRFYNGGLLVADYSNNRVLHYQTIASVNHAAADLVLGQPDFSGNAANQGGISASSLSGPMALYVSGGKLYISERNNNRIVVWSDFPSSNFQAANEVIGQSSFTTNSINTRTLSADAFYGQYGMLALENGYFLIADTESNRILGQASTRSASLGLKPLWDWIVGLFSCHIFSKWERN